MGHIKTFLKNWWHIPLGLLTALVCFFLAPTILRLFDSTAAAFDAGILHIINLVNVELLVYNAFAFIGIIVTFRPLATWFKHSFKNDFIQLTPWQKNKLFFSVYFCFVLCFVLLSLAL